MHGLRLIFIPHQNVNINNDKMFQNYVENYLDSFNGHYAGYIAAGTTATEGKRSGVFYQYIIENHSPSLLAYLQEYIARNPMHGYNVDIYEGQIGQPEILINV